MVKKVIEQYQCDKCGKEASRYSIVFPEATLHLDRCMLHAKKIEALRNETGEWITNTTPGKSSFRKTSVAELRAVVGAAKGNHNSE